MLVPIAAIANNTVTTAMLTSAGVTWQTEIQRRHRRGRDGQHQRRPRDQARRCVRDEPITSPRLPIPTRQIDIVNTRL